MTSQIVSFKWEGSENPNDPSGVVHFACGARRLSFGMNDFTQATRLDGLIRAACDRSKWEAIDRALLGISETLKQQRYG